MFVQSSLFNLFTHLSMSHRGQDTLRHVTNSPDPIVTRRRTSSPQGETFNGVDLTSPPQGETSNGADLTSPPQGGNPEKKLAHTGTGVVCDRFSRRDRHLGIPKYLSLWLPRRLCLDDGSGSRHQSRTAYQHAVALQHVCCQTEEIAYCKAAGHQACMRSHFLRRCSITW